MRKTRAGENEAVRQTLGNLFLLFSDICAVFMLLSPEVLSFLAPSSYTSALPILLVTVLSPIPICAAACSSSIAIAEEKVGGVILAGIIPISLSLIYLSYASRLGILQASLSVPIAYTLSALIECACAKRITGSRPFSPWLLLGISLSLSLFARISFLLKDLFYLRLVLLGSALLFILYMLYRLLPLILEKRDNDTHCDR
jgi:O-antigen/teichoic acid export membrane protein